MFWYALFLTLLEHRIREYIGTYVKRCCIPDLLCVSKVTIYLYIPYSCRIPNL